MTVAGYRAVVEPKIDVIIVGDRRPTMSPMEPIPDYYVDHAWGNPLDKQYLKVT